MRYFFELTKARRMEPVDQLQGARIVELDAAESHEAIGAIGNECFDTIQILGRREPKRDAIDGFEPGRQLLQEGRIAIVVNMGVHQSG